MGKLRANQWYITKSKLGVNFGYIQNNFRVNIGQTNWVYNGKLKVD